MVHGDVAMRDEKKMLKPSKDLVQLDKFELIVEEWSGLLSSVYTMYNYLNAAKLKSCGSRFQVTKNARLAASNTIGILGSFAELKYFTGFSRLFLTKFSSSGFTVDKSGRSARRERLPNVFFGCGYLAKSVIL
jgi:hypothetical protein